jgi:hypothetical protein
LKPLNERIAELEEWTDDEYRQKVEALRDKQKEAVGLHDAAKPVPPEQPASAEVGVALVKKYVGLRSKLRTAIDEAEARMAAEEIAHDTLSRGKQELLGVQTKMEELVTKWAADEVFVANGIDVNSLVTIKVDAQPIDAVCEAKLALVQNESSYVEKAQALTAKMDAFVERQRAGQTGM